LASRHGWTTRLINEYPGQVEIAVEGIDLSGLDNECGGHRIQRVPPTERKGRVHTSTVTVAVIDADAEIGSATIQENELRIEWYSGTGAGGQHRNKHQNSCRITHLPTGTVATAQCRSRQNSLAEALATIQKHIDNLHRTTYTKEVALDRKAQVGTGMRGDKIRTYRFQDDRVQDHNTGRSAKCSAVLRGHIDSLWEKKFQNTEISSESY
jgi:peptide chain release factor 1